MIRKEYTTYKRASNALDFDDLLRFLRKLLKEGTTAEAICRRYRYIMVDEYQDVTALQADIVYHLAKGCNNNVAVVGDDAQNIYAFRGTSSVNLKKFKRKFDGCRQIVLRQNYRSTQRILDLANALTANMRSAIKRELESAREGEGSTPLLLACTDARQQAAEIVKRIRQLERKGIPYGKQAVLYRNSRESSLAVQLELSRPPKIPFRVYGGKGLDERPHVRDFIAHLRILVNRRDAMAWYRVLTLVKGIGPKTADKMFQEIAEDPEGTRSILTRHSRKITGLEQLLASIRRASQVLNSGAVSPMNVMLTYYRSLVEDDVRNPRERYSDLTALCEWAERYRSLRRFLNYFTVVLSRSERAVHTSTEDSLTLSTIHSAKGLEWRVVYLMDLDDNTLPIRHAQSRDELEAEKRVLYVGVTRAKKRLYLSYYGPLSRFLRPANVKATYRTTERVRLQPRLY
jgi:DNA helicase II / ATP-dependent DNA helicase PcrA